MSKHWPKVKLGEVLERSEEIIDLQPDTAYRQITVKLWGKGVVLRGILTGAEIAASRQILARRGQFILSRIDARNGALGLVPPELDEAIVSNDFPLFNIIENRMLPAFLGWMCRTASFVEECKRASEGTTNRVRLREDKFLAREIPLPPLAEQKRIVTLIDELAVETHEACTLRHRAAEEAEALGASWLNSAFQRFPKNYLERLEDVAEIIGGGSLPDVAHVGETTAEVLLVKVSDMNRVGNEVFLEESANGLPRNSPLLRGFRILPVNSVVFPKRGGAIATNKKRILKRPAVLDPNTMGVFSKDEKRLTPEFLFKWFKNIDLASMQGGTSVPQINKGDLAPLEIPIPPLAEQRRIVSDLDVLQGEVDALKRLQTEAAAELDALLPSILNHAFSGAI
jgi:type I restriction enzyme S subunit